MKELTKTRRLTIASIVFILILIMGFVTFRKPAFVYNLSPEQSLRELNKPTNVVSPEDMMQSVNAKENSAILIDLRNPYQYNRGTLDKAINIPVSDILDEDVISMLDDLQNKGKTVILFAGDQQEANAPWMILNQLGYSNMKVLMGGFNYLSSLKNNQSDTIKATYQTEIPDFDYAALIEQISGGKIKEPQNPQPEAIIPVQRTKRTATAGGC